MNKQYTLSKKVWTEKDFEQMGWHDSHIHSISFPGKFELFFDIDYIFQWINPAQNEKFYKFWISPCSLIFRNVYNLVINIKTSTEIELEIADISRFNPKKPKNIDYINENIEWDWKIETQQGDISFTSVGYKQTVKVNPILSDNQFFSSKIRNKILRQP